MGKRGDIMNLSHFKPNANERGQKVAKRDIQSRVEGVGKGEGNVIQNMKWKGWRTVVVQKEWGGKSGIQR